SRRHRQRPQCAVGSFRQRAERPASFVAAEVARTAALLLAIHAAHRLVISWCPSEPTHLGENCLHGLPPSCPLSRHRQVRPSALAAARFGILHHLSECVHSKDNWRWSGAVGGSLRPIRTACTWSCTSGRLRSF